VILGLHLDAFGLECNCGEQKSVLWPFFCPQTLIFTRQDGGHQGHAFAARRYRPVPCGQLVTGNLPRGVALVPRRSGGYLVWHQSRANYLLIRD